MVSMTAVAALASFAFWEGIPWLTRSFLHL
jgi:hypothetical protein